MTDFQERVITEHSELQTRIMSLTAFLQTELFAELTEEVRGLLEHQSIVMNQYLNILAERIALFNAEQESES